jgi:molybdopterin-containing oxidoreductase family membrane subunit
MSSQGVLGVFPYLDSAVTAIRQLRQAGFRDLTVYTPVPRHELEEVLAPRESPIRLFTIAGGLLGCLTGYGFTAFTSLDWPIVVGGKPLFHMIPYTIIAFELTVLFGALATVLGLFINARLPRVALETVYDPRFTNDTIGVFVHCGPDRVAAAQDILTRAGAPEVRRA